MVRPDSQIKASKGPAVRFVLLDDSCFLHRLGKTLCRTRQAGLFPVRYAEQTLSMNWAKPPGMAGVATSSMCICEYWATANSSLLNKLLLERGLPWPVHDLCKKLYHSREQVVLENKPVLKRQ